MKRLFESVRVGTSQACVLHGHPKKAGSVTDKPAGSEIKCYPFSGEGGRAGAIKKAHTQHYAIQKSQERGEEWNSWESATVPGMARLQEVLSGSEALYGFCGWLTGRKEKTVMSASDECGGIAELIGKFRDKQNLPDPRSDWTKELIPMNPKGEGMERLEAEVALARGIHFKSKDWKEANDFSLSRRFPMVVMKGDNEEFWVVRPDDGERLAAAGYEFAR